MLVVGIDPGKKAPYHVAIRLGSTDVAAFGGSPISGGGILTAVVEGQFANRKASRQSLMTLSFYAGMQIGSYMQRGIDSYVVQPADWKNWLLPGGSGMNKTVFQNRLRHMIPDDIWAEGKDATDALCIAIVGGQMVEAGSKKLKRLDWSK